MKFNIIGAGNLGQHLAFALLSHGQAQLAAIYNRTMRGAQLAVEAIGSGNAVAQILELPVAELTFITTPDDAIGSVVSALISTIHAGSIVVHCSGALGSSVLMPLQEKGCHIASIHPLRAFRAQNLQKNAFQGCDCVVEGDRQAVEILTPLFAGLGAQVLTIDAANKTLYHAAAVMASNYLVTLAGCAVNLLQDAGFTEAQALQMTQGLMQSNLANLQKNLRVSQALTGPLARGDRATIRKHLQAIEDPVIHELYRVAGLATLPLTNHNSKTLRELKGDLGEEN